MMRKILFLSLLSYFASMQSTYSQAITAKLTGTPVLNNVTKDVEGSPYLYPSFNTGTLFLGDNKTIINNLQIRFNVLKEIVTYKDATGVELVPSSLVKQFVIVNNDKKQTFRLGFQPVDDFTLNTYYEVLSDDGGPLILKKNTKTLLSRKEYNSSKVTDIYLDATKYYVAKENGELTKFKTDKKSLTSYFPDKQSEMEQYLSKNKISFKNDDDLAKLFNYYLSIKSK